MQKKNWRKHSHEGSYECDYFLIKINKMENHIGSKYSYYFNQLIGQSNKVNWESTMQLILKIVITGAIK